MPEKPTFGPAFPVKPFCAVMAISEERLRQARACLTENWGPVECTTEVYLVDDITTYYQPEMGSALLKQFLVFKNLQTVAEMNQSKFLTAQWENEHRRGGKRTINLDPGYLTLDKLVLYTTKNFTHRIFIERGLFAEITLTYTRAGWRSHSWTYPDYQNDRALAFFTAARQKLYAQLHAAGELPKFHRPTDQTP